jgi:hypothetical protein
MKRALLSGLSAGLLALCGCAAGISRQGYTLRDINKPGHPTDCHLTVKCNATYALADADVVGHIEAFDTSVSINCDEAYVLDIFCKEACALGADVVNVTDEHYPNFWSTCYRAKAEFLRYKDRDQVKLLVSDAKYDPQLIIQRSKESKKRTEAVIIATVMGGVLGGLIVSAAH